MRDQFVTIATADRIGTVTLDSPPSNLLGTAALKQLDRIFGELEADPTVRVVILTARGRHFCGPIVWVLLL